MYADYTFLLQEGELTKMSDEEVELYFNEGIEIRGQIVGVSEWTLSNKPSDTSIRVRLEKEIKLYGVDFTVVTLPNGQKQFVRRLEETNIVEPLYLVLKEE
jgi:hypothetical protein